jgi:hypothetical protein
LDSEFFFQGRKREWVVDGSIWKWKDGMGAGVFVVILEGVHRHVCLDASSPERQTNTEPLQGRKGAQLHRWTLSHPRSCQAIKNEWTMVRAGTGIKFEG